MERICSICKISKPLTSDFFASRNDRSIPFQHTCKVCQKEIRKSHYQNNKDKYINKSKQWRKEQKIIFHQWMKDKHCIDCGISDIRVLEFDHLENKSFNISEAIGKLKLDTLLKEIEKCQIVCRNCHAIRTASRSNWYNFLQ